MSFTKIRTRKDKNRYKLKSRNKSGSNRISIFRSNQYTYLQLIDDSNSVTIASASSNEKDLRDSLKNGSNSDAAKAVGELLAKRMKDKKISLKAIFDRGGYKYHGNVKAAVEALRSSGVEC